ncbi:OmpA family protein [Oscillatoria sp. FACHB-1406]|uniref:OmpA family protein n=1 Tax=Oscillatoria sp. FACHB-1406 TaxID=2692846 RepID=UPI001688232F|nr:OmpA family protein [Oscillatoria sp. FACHB-1406]MBD2578103.1 OmpA family protein [Oscillatoria sp. FACHB-1406]
MIESTDSKRSVRKRVASKPYNTPPVNTNNPAPKVSPANAVGRWLGGVLFRLLLLGVGGTLAGIAGLLLAISYPHPNGNEPLVVRVWNGLQVKTKQLDKNLDRSPGSLDSLPPVSLTREEKQQLKSQLGGLQQDFNALRDRTQKIEARLSLPSSNFELPQRLETIDRTLQRATTLVGSTAIAVENASAATNQIKVVLPADVLFTPQNTLSKEAPLILDTVLIDLRRYTGSTLRIGVHSDSGGNSKEDQERSFRQAGILKDYLKERLGDNYRWVTVGYGQSRPLVANDSETNRQRNRRVEIAID